MSHARIAARAIAACAAATVAGALIAGCGIAPLPQSLSDACNVMQNSELVAETLGEHVFDFFLRNKREEWQEYRRQVTEFELDRYLSSL